MKAIWEFIVGDDWRTAVGVTLAIGATAVLQGAHITAWWLLPVAVLALLARSVTRR